MDSEHSAEASTQAEITQNQPYNLHKDEEGILVGVRQVNINSYAHNTDGTRVAGTYTDNAE